jgi:hypothetical protein
MALNAPIIFWGPGAASNVLRTRLRCTRCGARHTSLQHPGHVNAIVGTAPFPEWLKHARSSIAEMTMFQVEAYVIV